MAKNVVEFSIRAIDEASEVVKSVGNGLRGFLANLASSAAKLIPIFGAVTGLFLNFVGRITQRLDVFDQLSKRLGLSAEALSQLQFIAAQSGVDFNVATRALETMTRRVSEAGEGFGRATRAFDTLNLSVTDLNKLDVDEQFKTIAKALSELETPSERLRVAFQLFGREGAQVVQMLEDGVEGIEKLADESDRLGITMRTDVVNAAQEFQDAMDTLKLVSHNLAAELVANLLPVLTDIVNWFARFIPAGIAKMNRWLIMARQGYVRFAATFQEGKTKILEAMRAIQLAYQPWSNTSAIDKAIANSNASAESLWDLADAYNETIDAALEYERTLNSQTGLNRPARTVRERIVDEELEEIEVNAKRRYRRIRRNFFDPLKAAAEQAARNMQDAFADFFFDPFEEGLKGLLKNFIDVIRRMIAEILALQTVSKLGLDKLLLNAATGNLFGGGSIFGGGGGIVGKASKNGPLGAFTPITNIDARGADPSLIQKLPSLLEQRDKQLLLKVKTYVETGAVPL